MAALLLEGKFTTTATTTTTTRPCQCVPRLQLLSIHPLTHLPISTTTHLHRQQALAPYYVHFSSIGMY
jgi:hypothetical protein